MSDPVVYFGGTDQLPRNLRNQLLAHIRAVPPGGKIDWATYYFRDRSLAQALIAAQVRGVRVHVVLEGHPRRVGANDAVIALLRKGLGQGLKVLMPVPFLPMKIYPHLHAKIYAFSHPEPHVLIGSFNPSGDVPELHPEVIAEIGDQDQGQNLLAEFSAPELVAALIDYVRRLRHPLGYFERFRPTANRITTADATTLYCFPRIRSRVVEPYLATLGHGARILGSISHLKAWPFVEALRDAVKRGAEVSLLVHDTERRVPGQVVDMLAATGIDIRRYARPDHLPLHAKFLLTRSGADTPWLAWIGSYNYNKRSQKLNYELLVCCAHPAVTGALLRRFYEISADPLAFAA